MGWQRPLAVSPFFFTGFEPAMKEVVQRINFPTQTPVPREEWDRFPWNRWSFQNVRQMVATAEVWRGQGAEWSLPESLVDFDDHEFETYDGQQTTISQWLEDDYTDGFIVLKQGQIVYQRYCNHMTERTLHLSQSMAKSVTSCVAGILISRGLLDPGEAVTHYLPELKQTAYKDVKLRHVLDMASGVHYIEDYEDPESHIAAMDIASGWKLPREGFDAPASMWEHILSLQEVVRPHGESFNYRSIETDVLAHCMERVSNKRLVDLASEELWQPLGCEESACFSVDSTGYAFASGGFNATLRDYARFGQMLCDQGIGNGRQIVPADWIADTVNKDALKIDEARERLLPNGGYRNQFWLRDRNKRILMARGIYGQLIYVDQDQNLVAVVLASWPESINIDRGINTFNAIDAIAHSL